jgi:hypothetical protein
MGEAWSSSARSTGYEAKGTPRSGCSILARFEYMRVPFPAARIRQARLFFAFGWLLLTRILPPIVYHPTSEVAPVKSSLGIPEPCLRVAETFAVYNPR